MEMCVAKNNVTRQRVAKRGPRPLPDRERRDHCVSVRLNAAELAQLDDVRGRFQRGEWLRIAALDQLPPSIPAINRDAWLELARAAANLNQLAKHINQRGDADPVRIGVELGAFRRALLGAAG